MENPGTKKVVGLQGTGSNSSGRDGPNGAVSDLDRDSLHILPLAVMPLKSQALRKARLIKNARLENVVEMFRGKETGSGQISIGDVPAALGWPENSPFPDHLMLQNLGRLASYDVYSLRVTLRELGISVEDEKYLRLSDAKVAELTEYMKAFTAPLIIQIYGDNNMQIESYADLIGLFRNADVKEARQNLKLMAEKLHIRLDAVPQFFEDYGDIFLSLSYYKQCVDEIDPYVEMFLKALNEQRAHRILSDDANLMRACDDLEGAVRLMRDAIGSCLDVFDKGTRDMWDDISAQSFHDVERLFNSYHVAIGGTLCALTVKMDAWIELFPEPKAGTPMKRAEFIRSDMRQGLGSVQSLVESMPKESKYSV